jgi:hypothetical protein
MIRLFNTANLMPPYFFLENHPSYLEQNDGFQEINLGNAGQRSLFHRILVLLFDPTYNCLLDSDFDISFLHSQTLCNLVPKLTIQFIIYYQVDAGREWDTT